MSKAQITKIKALNILLAVLILTTLVLFALPNWTNGDQSASINGFSWLYAEDEAWCDYLNTSLKAYLKTNDFAANSFFLTNGWVDFPVDVNDVYLFPCALTVLFLVALALCVLKSDNASMAYLPLVLAVIGIFAFVFNPLLMMGELFLYIIIVFALIIIVSVVLIIVNYIIQSKVKANLVSFSTKDVNAKVDYIKSIDVINEKKTEILEKNFHQLINFLYDVTPECRIAACQSLSQTTRSVAVTHLSHIITTEENEEVKNEMRLAMASIKANIKAEHVGSTQLED